MWALRGPTAETAPLRTRSIDPPATPATRTSRARMAVAWRPTWTYDSAGRPAWIADTFDDVPPTSTITASPMRSDRSAPATDAAGPEYSVRAGALRKPARSVAPPSPRITM